MFRHERPQSGRFRRFHQFGVEVLGGEQALVDAEEKRKNPPKQNGATRIGGNFLSDIFAYYTSGSKSEDNPPDAKIIGGGLAAGGFLLLLKSLAPFAPLLL